MRHPPLQPGWIDAPHRSLALGDFALESGQAIADFRLSYVLHGRDAVPVGAEQGVLAGAERVVVALSAIASTHHRLDFLIGEALALDPRDTVVIAIDAIGNGLTTSPSTSLRQPGLAFPAFTIRDMVASQAALLDHLGVDRPCAVIGASMGGMQALQWAVSQAPRLRAVVAMTPMARTTPWAVAINETSRRALLADPAILARGPGGLEPSGRPDGWGAWIPLMQLLSGRTPAQVDAAFGSGAEVIRWIEARTDWWRDQQYAAVDWLYQSRAYDAHDVGTTPGFDGDTDRALASITVPVLIAAPPLDLYNPADAARAAAARIPGARFVEIASPWGHQAAGPGDPAAAAQLNREIRGFLG
ncbi:MAG: alpha/beta fold hydrolase [Lautropia sp.]